MWRSSALACCSVWILLAAGGFSSAAGRGELVRTARQALGEAELALAEGNLERARERYARALEHAESLGSPNLLLARATDGLADVHRVAGELDRARERYTEALGLWETLLGPEQPRLAVTLHNLGAVHLARGEPEQAAAALRRALAIFEAAGDTAIAEAENTRRALRVAVAAAAR